jgi:hypothetical protein
MGLKNIHLLFIAMAVALCVAFGAWCVWMYGAQARWGYLVGGAVSFAAALGLMAYGNWFLNTRKGMHDQ